MITLSPVCASLEHLVTRGFVLQVWTAAMLCAAHQLLLLLDHTGGGVHEPCPMLAHSSQTWWPQICFRWVQPHSTGRHCGRTSERQNLHLCLEPRGRGPPAQGLISGQSSLYHPAGHTVRAHHSTALGNQGQRCPEDSHFSFIRAKAFCLSDSCFL